MRLLLLNHFQNARESLRANRMRTFLTITGVTIGVSSIVAILSLAGGAGSIVTRQVDDLGGNIAVVRPGDHGGGTLNDLANQQAHRSYTASSLNQRDVDAIKKLTHVDMVAPVSILTGTLEADSVAPSSSTTLVATTADFLPVSNVALQAGQFVDSKEPNAVIGAQLSINLFGTENSLGKTFRVRGAEFRVAGIMERQKNPVNFNGFNLDNAAIIPLQLAGNLGQVPQIQQINVRADSVANLERVVIDANKVLLENHGGEKDFSVLTGDSISEPTSQLFMAIAGVTAAIAGISLLVGGIGIMNIMLVNVAERTREIGIRKALGATSGDIVWQFLIESLIMGLAGGILGIIFGLALAFVISLFLTFNPSVNWLIPVVALSTSALIGVCFGLYPAYRAAKKNPIDSLRQQN